MASAANPSNPGESAIAATRNPRESGNPQVDNGNSNLNAVSSNKHGAWAIPLLAVALVVVTLAALAIGAFPVSIGEIWSSITHGITGQPQPDTAGSVLWDIRMPRVLLAVVVGACLASAGAIMQGIFANPLAEPAIVGVSSGAAVAAVVAIFLGLTALGTWMLPAAAFVGGLLVTFLVYSLSRVNGRSEVLTLVLVGIAVNAFAGALIGLVMSISNDAQLRSITFWNLGSLSTATWGSVLSVLPFAILGIIAMPWLAHRLDLLALGERAAAHLGVDVESFRRWSIVLVAMLTAAAVAVSGIIAFVGLVVPHTARLIVGPGHKLLLPVSALTGATLLVLADVISRTAVEPREIPIGVLTALVGAPVFFYLLRREHKRRGAFA